MLCPLFPAALTVGGGGEPESTDMGLGSGSHSSAPPPPPLLRSLFTWRVLFSGLGLGDDAFRAGAPLPAAAAAAAADVVVVVVVVVVEPLPP